MPRMLYGSTRYIYAHRNTPPVAPQRLRQCPFATPCNAHPLAHNTPPPTTTKQQRLPAARYPFRRRCRSWRRSAATTRWLRSSDEQGVCRCINTLQVRAHAHRGGARESSWSRQPKAVSSWPSGYMYFKGNEDKHRHNTSLLVSSLCSCSTPRSLATFTTHSLLKCFACAARMEADALVPVRAVTGALCARVLGPSG